MKKVLIFILSFIFIRVYAISNIEINGSSLIPYFDKEINVYNYFTSSDSIIVNVKYSNDEVISGSGYYELLDGKNTIIVSSNDEEYIIHVFKNYKNDNNKEGIIENISIKNHNINFNKNNHEYFVDADDNCLDINVELSNDNTNYEITGNCNFNSTDNIIKIKTDTEEYIIHALKSKIVSYESPDNISSKDLNNQKKEIVLLIIITISCILVFLFYYSLFINKTILNI